MLDEHPIACANVPPGMRSPCRWRGAREAAVECGVLLKTNGSELAAALARRAALHSHYTPPTRTARLGRMER